MDIWDIEVAGDTVRAWAVAAGVAATVMLLLYGLRMALRRAASARLVTHGGRAPQLVSDLAGRLGSVPIALVALSTGARVLALPDAASAILNAALVVALVVQAAIWGNRVIAFSLERYGESRVATDPGSIATIGALSLVARIILWSVLLLVLLDNFGIDVTAVVAGLGIGGIAVALAAQNILSDLFSSLSIMLDRPFVVGDFIIVGTEMGTVEHIGLKTTRVRSLSGEQLVFSNQDILQSRIRNYQRLNERRILFILGVTYQTTHGQLEAIPGMLRGVVEAQDGTRFDRAHFARFADSVLEFEVVYYVLHADYNVYMDVQERINLDIYRRFEEAGIEFGYPTRTVHLQGPGTSERAGAGAPAEWSRQR